MIYPTFAGVQISGATAVALRRAPAAYAWAHHEACAQMAAYLTVRGRAMVGPRELLVDERWTGTLAWSEHGETRRRRHRPDFIATGEQARRIAVEVELSPKSPQRLRAVLGMYAGWLAAGRIDSLLYVVTGPRERTQLGRQAPRFGLQRGDRFGIQDLAEITDRLTQPHAELVTG